ncbi:MAG: 16S rRNA (cytidine(1402)-2'-O)-methyltransferase [Candidatus Goldbacteria bacterium]|nr:16S rRNA (cytidine(1402)-2'-O)-methyltransferase [Candidatus Goldiibacteriota bacterium]HPD18223.1 16S rRNA (cytidine(1402)-2'-O)-methyltransferase [Candidatus Goldiibacteriota bacterium]
MNSGKFYIIPTPIGNMSDITIRAIDVLKKSNLIIAEDTRVTQKLLNHYRIKTKLISYHKFNEEKRVRFILELLSNGNVISLVSDAGTPLLSDPGFIITKEVIEKGISMEVLPGPSSILPSILLSGFNPQKFVFYGFLDKKDSKRKQELIEISKIPYPVVIFESPFRILKLMEEILELMGNREIAVIKELTKIHENVFRGKINEVVPFLNKENLKGEFVVVIGHCNEVYKKPDISIDELSKKINYYVKTGRTRKEIVGIISDEFGLTRNEAYKVIHNKTEV